MVINGNFSAVFPPNLYVCEICDHNCCKKSHFIGHLSTSKHRKKAKMVTNGNFSAVFPPPDIIDDNTCECGRVYKYKSGLSRHKKVCSFMKKDVLVESIDKELLLTMMKEQSEIKKMILESCKNNTNHTLIQQSNVINNKFNLNLFLNEKCKDAINLTDFVDSINLQLSDLENVGKVGFVNGITNIIIKNLNALDITQRPVHCSDTKREIIYVKEQDKWEKEKEEKIRLRMAVKKLAHKNIKLLPEFKAKYPDCIYSDSKKSDEYNKLIIEAFGGSGNEDVDNENKIIKNLAKEVVIDKKER